MTLAATPSLAAPAGLDDSRLLPAGTRLDEFEILRPLGVGGFGIVYLALDHSLLRQVALKEFMPAELAARGPGGIVMPRSPQRAEQFQRLLESFFNEARLLAPFNHPALVRVHRFW
jgi:serine/threonine protein kinase